MDPRRIKTRNKKAAPSGYLEIYIEVDGRLILTPLTNKTLPVFKVIPGSKKDIDSVYCG